MEKKETAKSEIVEKKMPQLKSYEHEGLEKMPEMAKVLKGYIVKHGLYTEIQGKVYVHVDGWAFAGAMMGITPIIREVTDLSKDNEVKWLVHVTLETKDGRTVGAGFATCSNKESRKKSFDEYAIMSMAQTRAIGKAYRSVIGWVVKLAGYEATPSEEVQDESSKKKSSVTDRAPIEEDTIYQCEKCGVEVSSKAGNFMKAKIGRVFCKNHVPTKKK